MGVYVPKNKINPGRVGMATKKVVIDINVDVPETIISEDKIQEILTRVHNEYVAPLQEQIDEIRTKTNIQEEDISLLTSQLMTLSDRIDDIEDNRITEEDKQEIKELVVAELQEEIAGLKPVDIYFEGENENLTFNQ